MEKRIGFIGTGHMGRALARGLIRKQIVTKDKLFGYDSNPPASQKFVEQTGGKSLNSIRELVSQADVVYLAVKPQQMKEVLKSVASLRAGGYNPLWITVAAGIPIKTYLKDMGETARLVRVMPNSPCIVGEGVSGFTCSDGVGPEDAKLAMELLEAVGLAIQFPERQLDAVSGLSGSGSAFVYMMIESMADGGVKMGLSREHATQLAAQTVLGAAMVLLQTGEHPGMLKDKVCSPRGTTISGVHVLEQLGFRSSVISAVEASTLRSQELGADM